MQRIEGLSIGLQLDTMKVDSGLKDLKSKMDLLNSELKLNMSAFDRGEKSIGKYKTQLDGLNKKVEAQKVVTESARKHYEKMVKEHGEGSAEADKAAKAYNNEAAQLNNLQRYVKNVTDEMKEFQRQQKIQSSGWNKVGESLTNLGNGLKTVSEKAQNVGKSLTKKITMPAVGAASALAGIALVKGFDRLVGIDTAKAKLKGLGHDAKSVEGIMNSALESVKGTAHGMDEAATTAAGAVAAGVKPGKELTRYLTITGDAAAIAGSSMSEMGSIINKVQTAQKAYTGELNQLADRGIPIFQWIGKEAGVSAEQVREMASKGKVSSEMFLAAIENNIGGAAKKMGEESFTAGISNMWAAVGRLGASFLDAGGKGGGFFSQLKPMIADFTERIDSMGDMAQKAGVKVGKMFSAFVDKIKDMKARYDDMSPAMQDFTKKAALIGTTIAVGIGPALTVFGKVGGVVALASTKLGILSKAIADAGGFVKWLRLGLTALTGPVGITIAVITGLATAFTIAYKKSETFRNMIDGVVTKIKAVIAMFKGDWLGGRDMLSNLGMGPDTILKFENGVIAVKLAFKTVVDFFKAQGKVLQDFWKQNKDTILQAVSNIGKVIGAVFMGIWKVIQFVMPAVLAIIKTIWGNIQGVIKGALNVIMGAIKLFSGLFTGDFKKMWEGIKQIFRGAIEFVWNYMQLMFIGRIVKGVGGFVRTFGSTLKSGWDNAIGGIRTFVGNAKAWFKSFADDGLKKFNSLVDGAKALPGKIGNGIKSMAGKVSDGVRAVANKMAEGLGKGVNGVIGGVNWVLKKVGIKNLLPLWTVPQYAKGTDGHPETGPAVVGDGVGSNAGAELIQTPDGKKYLSPARPTLVNLPKGTQVLPASLTKQLIPHYAWGVGDLWKSVKQGAKKAKEKALDVWSYISNPSKLFNKALEMFGVETPSFPGVLKDMGKGLYGKAKDALKDFLVKKVEGIGSSFGGNAPGNVKQWIMQAIAATGVPQSWAGPLTTIAMKESDGNPKAINLWDINAKRGIPSKGLMQTIDPTFNAHKLGSMSDIWNPVHNAVAAIRYIQSRYGNVFNVPGIKSLLRGGAYKGYATGGRVGAGLYPLGEDGWPEWIIPTDPARKTDAMKLLALAGREISGNKRPHQLPNVSGSGDDSIMVKLLDATLQQNQILMRILQKDPTSKLDLLELSRGVSPYVKQFIDFDNGRDGLYNKGGAY